MCTIYYSIPGRKEVRWEIYFPLYSQMQKSKNALKEVKALPIKFLHEIELIAECEHKNTRSHENVLCVTFQTLTEWSKNSVNQRLTRRDWGLAARPKDFEGEREENAKVETNKRWIKRQAAMLKPISCELETDREASREIKAKVKFVPNKTLKV